MTEAKTDTPPPEPEVTPELTFKDTPPIRIDYTGFGHPFDITRKQELDHLPGEPSTPEQEQPEDKGKNAEGSDDDEQQKPENLLFQLRQASYNTYEPEKPGSGSGNGEQETNLVYQGKLPYYTPEQELSLNQKIENERQKELIYINREGPEWSRVGLRYYDARNVAYMSIRATG